MFICFISVDFDHFFVWLTNTQTAVASSEAPQSLVEVEQMLNQHQTIKEEIDRYVPDYSLMKEYGDRVCANADASDPQYLFLRERLNALDQGWNKLVLKSQQGQDREHLAVGQITKRRHAPRH